MLRKVTPWRHVVAGLSVVGVSALGGSGIIGAGDQAALRGEHFDAKQVTVVPVDDDGVRIREVVDIDFGVNSRRGYQRIIPNDFGAPTDVIASSPDANGELNISSFGTETRMRIGNPGITFTGQRRYILEYTLPDAQRLSGELNLDIIGNDETFTTDRFEVILSGFEFASTYCDTGDRERFGGCDFERSADDFVAVIEPLEAGEGITVGGQLLGVGEPAPLADPGLPERNPSGWRPFGFLLIPFGALAAAAVFAVARHLGSNEVSGAGGAADAAFGGLPVPSEGDVVADVPTYRVPDSRLARLATVEFVPPRGLEPWHGTALLDERASKRTVVAWFSEMIARGEIEVEQRDGKEFLIRGTSTGRLHGVDAGYLTALFVGGDEIELGKYDEDFTKIWKRIEREHVRFLRDSGWWSDVSGSTRISGRLVISMLPAFLIAAVLLLAGARAILGSSSQVLSSPVAGVVIAVLLVAVVAFLVYKTMLPSRTATGSALALRTESFRRFLAASEGRHVEWAHEHGLVREYSAWAVALGAAEAWSKAVESSNIPHPEVVLHGPLLLYSSLGSFTASTTPPSSSGGGGGGFGGGVGGGGGGGSSGSW